MSYSGTESELSEQQRNVTIRSILLGVFFCVILGIAIPYFDIMMRTSELGGCHFPVGPIFFMVGIIFMINIPLKSGSRALQAVFAVILGVFTAVAFHRFMETELAANIIIAAVSSVIFLVMLLGLSVRGRLNSRELIVIFAMMLIGSGIPTFGLISQVLPMTAAWQHLSPGRGWDETFFQHLPDWLVVGNPEHMIGFAEEGFTFEEISTTHYLAIEWFYGGLPEGVTTRDFLHILGDWLKPAIGWGIFITLIYTYMFSITSILRKQWVERERLSFPLMQLPVELAQNEESAGLISPLFKNPWLIGGVGIPLIVHSLLQMRRIVMGPAPNPLRMTANIFGGTGFEAFGSVYMYVNFAVIGFCYLLSKEMAFSIWAFFLLNRFQRVVHDMAGLPPMVSNSDQPGAAQFFGALAVFVIFGLYAARGHLATVFRKAFTRAPDIDDSSELMGYRASVFALLISMIGLISWCAFMGMQVWVAVMVLAIFTLSIIGITRAVAEGGILFVKLESAIPGHVMNNLTGTAPISAPSLTVLGIIQYVSMFDLKTLLMPAVMQGCKARDTVNDRSKKTLAAFVIAIVVVVLVSGAGTMWGVYNLGASNVHPWFYMSGPGGGWGYGLVHRWINQPTSPDFTAISYMIGGGLVTGLLIFLRRSLPWWPLHPLGYIVSDGFYESNRVWFSFFIGWLMKVFILSFGGGKWFKKMRPFFLGLILGEFGTAGLWIVIGLFTGDFGSRIFP